MNVSIKGTIIDFYEKPIFVNKETGESSPVKYAVQMLSNLKLNNGETKKDLVDITVDEKDINKYKSNIGKEIDINCKLYSKTSISLTAV